jgi:hypothetical protein
MFCPVGCQFAQGAVDDVSSICCCRKIALANEPLKICHHFKIEKIKIGLVHMSLKHLHSYFKGSKVVPGFVQWVVNLPKELP